MKLQEKIRSGKMGMKNLMVRKMRRVGKLNEVRKKENEEAERGT